MNIRQAKYKKNRIAGMNMYNAAIAAGYSENYARNARPEKLVKGGIQAALERAGLTDKYQAEKLEKLTKATKAISCNVYIDKNGEMKNADGKSMDFIEVDDNPTQIAALKHIADLKGQNKHIVKGEGFGGDTHIHVSPKKVLIFKDLKNAASDGEADNLHADKGAERNRGAVKV